MQALEQLSVTQQRVLKWIYREPNRCEVQVAGHGRAPLLSAARALVRKGLARTFNTGRYAATEAGRALVDEWCKRTKTKLKPLY